MAQRRPDVWRRWCGYVQSGPNGCALWTGPSKDGVPRFDFGGRHAARDMALWFAGRRRGRTVFKLITTCGEPSCVAVDHILEVRPVRRRARTKVVLAAATRAEIVRLRHETDLTLPAIAARCGCSPSTVSKIAGPRRRPQEAVA